MIKIDYPGHAFKIKKEKNSEFIFDELRKAWLRLTPEEWVRQNFIHHLTNVLHYPSTLIAQEKKIVVGELHKRFDILIYNPQHKPWMMVECKAMEIALKEEVLNQVLRYNMAVPVKYLVITNGTSCMAFKKQDAQLVPLNELPAFGE